MRFSNRKKPPAYLSSSYSLVSRLDVFHYLQGKHRVASHNKGTNNSVVLRLDFIRTFLKKLYCIYHTHFCLYAFEFVLTFDYLGECIGLHLLQNDNKSEAMT